MLSYLINLGNPLDQFVIRPAFGNFKFGISTFTMDTLLVAGVTFFLFYLLIFANKNLSHLYTFSIAPALKTLSYGGVVGSKRYRPLFVFIFVLVAMSNLMGLIPFSLTATSFAVTTFFLGMTVFVGINILALAMYQGKYVNLFLPSGAPLIMAPYLIVLEVISYFARVMSLSIRLFANLLAGHALMKIIGTFVGSTPLIAAGLITSLRPIASTHEGFAESFWAFIGQINGYGNDAVKDFAALVKQGDFGLYIHGVGGAQIGAVDALSTVGAYVATGLVAFTAVALMLYIVAYYLHEELATSLVDHFANAKSSIGFKPVGMVYGFRAGILTLINAIKPADFKAVRQSGVVGMILFVWAAFKYASRLVLFNIYSYVGRGTSMATKVSLSQVFSGNTYVAPVLSQAFGWIVIVLALTVHYVKLLQYLGFAQVTGVSISGSDVFTSKLGTFGPFGMGIVLSVVLTFTMLVDVCGACWAKFGSTEDSKVNKFMASKACVGLEGLVAVIIGLFAGYVQVAMYYTMFDVAFASAWVPDSFVFGALVRIGHGAPAYLIPALFLAVVLALVAEKISDSMNSDENRGTMKLLGAYGPAVILGAILCELLYGGLMYDVMCVGVFEAYMLKVHTAATSGVYYADVWGSGAGYRAYTGALTAAFITHWDLLGSKMLEAGLNPVAAVAGSVASGAYVFVTFFVSSLTSFIYYIVVELDAIVLAGFNSIIALVALITLPLITPLAGSFLLAITGLEMAIALLQAYVFITLSSMYLNDVIKLH